MTNRVVLNWFTYFGMAFYTQAITPVLSSADKTAGETNIASTISQIMIFFGLTFFFLQDPRKYLRSAAGLAPLASIVIVAIISTLWSDLTLITFRRSLAYAECALFGTFLFVNFGPKEIVRRFGWVIVCLGLLSVAFYFAFPSIGREHLIGEGHENSMKGVFPQKNALAGCMLLGLCCFFYQVVDDRAVSKKGILGILVLFGCIILARGMSSLIVALVIVTISAVMLARDRPVFRVALLFLVGWTVFAIGSALAIASNDVFALFGRDTTLTGRLPLWQALGPEILRHPLLGHGYAGFWIDTSTTVQYVWLLAGWKAPDAHNSYLDILLQLGMVGAALFLWLWWKILSRAFLALNAGFGFARWTLLYSTALLLISCDEGPLPITNGWTMLLPVALLAARTYADPTRGGAEVATGQYAHQALV